MHTTGQTNGYRPLPHGSLSETRSEAAMRTLTVDATTAEKLERTSCAWGGCRPPSFSASVLSRSPTITSPLFHPFLFPPPLEYSCKRFGENLLGCPAKKMTPSVAKVGGDRLHLVPTISKVGVDASHGSHGGGCFYDR